MCSPDLVYHVVESLIRHESAWILHTRVCIYYLNVCTVPIMSIRIVVFVRLNCDVNLMFALSRLMKLHIVSHSKTNVELSLRTMFTNFET